MVGASSFILSLFTIRITLHIYLCVRTHSYIHYTLLLVPWVGALSGWWKNRAVPRRPDSDDGEDDRYERSQRRQ